MNALEDFLEWMDKPISDENTPTYYGWTICAVAALQVFFSGPGQTYSISNFKSSYVNDYAWSESTISSLYAAGTTLSALLLPVVGRAVDRVGQRRASFVAGWGLVTACVVASTVSSPLTCFVSFFLKYSTTKSS